MFKHDSNTARKKEGDVHKGLPEVAPNALNPYEEDDCLSTDNSLQHDGMPGTIEESQKVPESPCKNR
jgi:hypothetical protein